MIVGPMPTEIVITTGILLAVLTGLLLFLKWDDRKRWRAICERAQHNRNNHHDLD